MNQKINLDGYEDSYWAGSAIDRKSTSGCCFSMGSVMISWLSRKQFRVGLSTTKVEYVVACSTSCEAVRMRKVLSDLLDLYMLRLVMKHRVLRQLHTTLVVAIYTSSIQLKIKQIR